jgi:hypothetical protein
MASSDGYAVRYDKDRLRRACERGCRGERVETMWTGGGIEGSCQTFLGEIEESCLLVCPFYLPKRRVTSI